jgi:hypothetical protein
MADHRLVAVILEVSDLDSSVDLYRDAFGLDLHPGDNAVDDRWTGGCHAEISWTEGAYLHFSLYPAKEQPTSAYRSACPSTTSKQLMQPQSAPALVSFTNLVTSPGVGADAMQTSTETSLS